jgi:nicotinate dehydrogenase subunit B
MTKHNNPRAFSRRAVLKTGGALVVSIGMPIGLDTVLAIGEARAQGARPPLTPDQLSSYIAVNADGTVSAYFGKMDMGQGLFVAIGQIVAEELDVPFGRVKVIMDRHPARRQADARRRRGGAPCAGGDGGRKARLARRSAHRG